MRFNPRARIDQSQIETRSGGGGGGGGMRLPMPGAAAAGGKIGIGTIVVIILFVVLTQCMGVDILGGGGAPSGSGDQSTANECRTGEDANKSEACAIDLFTNSVQDYWKQAYPDADGRARTRSSQTVRFEGSTDSGCGPASAEMGPFYCPNDRKVYLDTTFFDDMLEGQLGAKGGPFAIGYVIAHEYGHHIEDQLGILGKIRTQTGPEERRGARRADGRLPGRRVGQGRPGDRGRPGRADHRRADPGRHQARHRRGPGGRRRPDPEAHVRAGGHRLLHPRLGRAAGALVQPGHGRSGTIKGCDTFATDDL